MQQQPIPIFIGMDPRERAATNVLLKSLSVDVAEQLNEVRQLSAQLH